MRWWWQQQVFLEVYYLWIYFAHPFFVEFERALAKFIKDQNFSNLRIWTSLLRSTIQTVASIDVPKEHWKALNEIDAVSSTIFLCTVWHSKQLVWELILYACMYFCMYVWYESPWHSCPFWLTVKFFILTF